jgi:hypothetical protein
MRSERYADYSDDQVPDGAASGTEFGFGVAAICHCNTMIIATAFALQI